MWFTLWLATEQKVVGFEASLDEDLEDPILDVLLALIEDQAESDAQLKEEEDLEEIADLLEEAERTTQETPTALSSVRGTGHVEPSEGGYEVSNPNRTFDLKAARKRANTLLATLDSVICHKLAELKPKIIELREDFKRKPKAARIAGCKTWTGFYYEKKLHRTDRAVQKLLADKATPAKPKPGKPQNRLSSGALEQRAGSRLADDAQDCRGARLRRVEAVCRRYPRIQAGVGGTARQDRPSIWDEDRSRTDFSPKRNSAPLTRPSPMPNRWPHEAVRIH